MSVTFQSTQVGWIQRGAGILMAVGFAVAAARVAPREQMMLLLTALTVGAAAWLFGSLTVRVDREAVRWHFGIGWPGWSLRFEEIVEAHAVRTAWWTGWGVRYTRTGWLYKVRGHDAVLLARRGGAKPILIGTDEPERLLAAIEQQRAQR